VILVAWRGCILSLWLAISRYPTRNYFEPRKSLLKTGMEEPLWHCGLFRPCLVRPYFEKLCTSLGMYHHGFARLRN